MSIKTMESMVRWVEENVTENPTLESMSSHVGYSPYYCSVKFREYMGMTYKQYLAKCRLRAAVKLLLASKAKIIDIAFLCGYSSAESFSRAFMEAYQCSPTQYRRKHFEHSVLLPVPGIKKAGDAYEAGEKCQLLV